MPVPRPRSAMRKIRGMTRLTFREGLSRRATAAATGLPFTTVSDHVARAERAGLGWPLPPDMDCHELALQYVIVLACAELTTLRRALRRRPTVDIKGWHIIGADTA